MLILRFKQDNSDWPERQNGIPEKLFNNDEVEMKYVLERLNEARTLDDAKEYLSDLYYDRDWKPVDEYAQRLWSLVESRFR